MSDVCTRIAAGGRIVIPADFRREMGADVGDEVILRFVDGEVHILTRRIPAGRSLVKELLQERRKEGTRG